MLLLILLLLSAYSTIAALLCSSALPALPTVLSDKHASVGDSLIPLKKLLGWIELINHRQKHA